MTLSTSKVTGEERDRIRQLVIESRRRQGLPDTIEDPVFLSRIAAILLDPIDLPTPDSNGEPPPVPDPGDPEVPA